MNTQMKNNLLKLIRKLSYREGNFTLASGKTSSYYVDLKNVTLHPDGARLIAQLSWSILNPRDYAGVGGPTLGADPLATALSLVAAESGVTLPAYILRKEAKKHGTSQWIEGRENLKTGGRLLVVEDVVTTGGSSLKSIEKIRAEGFIVDTCLCVLDRKEGGEKALNEAGVRCVALATIEEVQATG